ncbi:MAG: hypothetical protein WC667_13315 [Sulfurimonas sp.]
MRYLLGILKKIKDNLLNFFMNKINKSVQLDKVMNYKKSALYFIGTFVFVYYSYKFDNTFTEIISLKPTMSSQWKLLSSIVIFFIVAILLKKSKKGVWLLTISINTLIKLLVILVGSFFATMTYSFRFDIELLLLVSMEFILPISYMIWLIYKNIGEMKKII